MSKREEEARKRMEEINNTHYDRAIKIFLKIMGISVQHDNIARMAKVFLAIAEMSLNPPLPPFGIINKLELDWNKIYPPLRFIELSQIAKRVPGTKGYITDYADDWYYEPKITSLYLSQGGVFSYLSMKDGHLPDEKFVPFLAAVAEDNKDQLIPELLRLLGVNTVGMAEKLPEVLTRCTGLEVYAMLRHGLMFLMYWFGRSFPFLTPPMAEDEDEIIDTPPLVISRLVDVEEIRALLMPPLVVFEDRIDGWSEVLAQNLVTFNLYHYPLQDVLLGRILRREPRLYLPDSPLIDEKVRKLIWDDLQQEQSFRDKRLFTIHQRNTVLEKNTAVANSFRQSESSEYS